MVIWPRIKLFMVMTTFMNDWLDSRLKTLYVTILREVGKRMESLLPELDLFKKGAVTVALYKSTG